MNKYELTVLANPDLEPTIADFVKVIEKIVADNKGKIVSNDDWGKKKLEYKIAGQTHAIYRYFVIELPGEAVAKVDQTLNITDGVIRHLIVREDEKKVAAIAAAK